MLKTLLNRLFPYTLADLGHTYVEASSDAQHGDIRVIRDSPQCGGALLVNILEIDRRTREDFRSVKLLRMRPGIHTFRLQIRASPPGAPWDDAPYKYALLLTSQSASFPVAHGGSYVLSAMFQDEQGSVFSVKQMRSMMQNSFIRSTDLRQTQYAFVPILYSLPEKPSPLPCAICGKSLPYAGNIALETEAGILRTSVSRTVPLQDPHDRWEGYVCSHCRKIVCADCPRSSADTTRPPAQWYKCECGATLLPAERVLFQASGR